MRQIADHVLDIAQNSVFAGATLVRIKVLEDLQKDILEIMVEDNGCGMEPSLVTRVLDPFVSTRKKKTGLGLPLLNQAAVACGGELSIESEVGQGTTVKASFRHSHVDRAPLGDIVDNFVTLITNEGVDFSFHYEAVFSRQEQPQLVQFHTRQVREVLGEEISLNNAEVLAWIRKELTAEYESVQRKLQTRSEVR